MIRTCDCWYECGNDCPFADTEFCGAYIEKNEFISDIEERIKALQIALENAKKLKG